MGEVLAYYRLMAAWLLHLVAPASVAGGDVDLPLPSPPTMAFRVLPVSHLQRPPLGMPRHAPSVPCVFRASAEAWLIGCSCRS